MTNYLYYQGCSLEASAIEYDVSTRKLMEVLGASLTEIEDWNCCGATAAETVSGLLSFVLPARNLALAQNMVKKMKKKAGDILVPCSACYLNLKKVEQERKNDPVLASNINEALAEDELTLEDHPVVRHLLDVLANDIGADKIRELVTKKLDGLKIALYYGCQCLRPYAIFDDPEEPRSMEPLIEACGAEVFAWDMGAACCGASNMSTKKESARVLVTEILKSARGADAIVTVCPMCQMNLEGYQDVVSRGASEDLSISVIYLPQLIGIALGLTPDEIMLNKNLAVKKSLMETHLA